MAVISFPDSLYAVKMSWSQQRMAIGFNSPFGSQTVEASPPVWVVSLTSPSLPESQIGTWKSLFMRLRGSTNQLSMHDPARPEPIGTLRGAYTLTADATQGDVSLEITSDTYDTGDTLVAGDLLGIGTGTTQQVVMVTEDAACDASGNIVVNIEPPLRNSFSLGTSVTWDKPKVLFRVQNKTLGWDYESVMTGGFSLDLQEDWRT